MLEADAAHLKDRTLERGDFYSACQWFLCTVFRGQRRSRAGTGSFGKMDGERVADYVRSHDGAWDALLDASLAAAALPLEPFVVRSGQLHSIVHRQARDTMAAMANVMARDEAAFAIFAVHLTADNGVEVAAASAARAASTARKLKAAMELAAGASEAQDPHSVVEGLTNQVAASCAHWVGVFGIPFDFEKALGLKGGRRAAYRGLAVPLAVATIKKGGTLSMEEYRAAMGRR